MAVARRRSSTTSRGARRAGRAFCLGATLALCASGPFCLEGTQTFSAAAPGGGLTRQQQRSQQRTRANLPGVLEVPPEEPPAEQEPVPDMPDRRVPYSMNIVSHFPNNKHLHEVSAVRKTIEQKLVRSLEKVEDLIRHVDVNLQVSENFHREKPTHHKVALSPATDGEVPELVLADTEPPTGAKQLTPYIFKVTVTLKNQRVIVLGNAEKHAQATLTEGLDHVVEVLRKSLREEKEKVIDAKKRHKAAGELDVEAAFDADELEEANGELEGAMDLASDADEANSQLTVCRKATPATAAMDNHSNQCNPNNKAYQGHDGHYQGSRSQADLDNHSRQMNPGDSRYGGSPGGRKR